MKDIDFDELDKAVNSLMATSPGMSSPNADDVKPETTLEVSSSQPIAVPAAPSADIPVADTAAEAVPVTLATPVVPTTPSAPVAPAIKRTGGRFMDMVHTSSEMKPRSGNMPLSREGLSISPRSTSTPEIPAAPAEEAVAPTVAATPEPEAPTVMPDPIELSNALAATMDEPVAVTEPTADSTPVSAESPFIADAKVDKRPLNAGGASTAQTYNEQFANELGASETAEQPEAAPTDAGEDEPPITPQIPELSSDLVAIESNDKIEEPVAPQSTDTTDAASGSDAPATPLGATSIAKQYTPQPSTGDQSHAAIYDASQYPEPVAHPAKKKSGWLWVLWVVLLLGVGAGAAALLYFLGIIP